MRKPIHTESSPDMESVHSDKKTTLLMNEKIKQELKRTASQEHTSAMMEQMKPKEEIDSNKLSKEDLYRIEYRDSLMNIMKKTGTHKNNLKAVDLGDQAKFKYGNFEQ